LKIPIQVHWELPIGVKKDRDGDWYVSWCPVLDIYSQGETRERALENIIEATQRLKVPVPFLIEKRAEDLCPA